MGCSWKSSTDFERSPRLFVQDGVSGHQSTISRSLHKAGFYGQVARKKPLLKKTHLKARMEFWESILMKLPTCGEMVCDQTKQKLKFLVEIHSVTSGASPTLHITQLTPSLLSTMVVAASYHGAAFHQQGLKGLSG